jgi:hypothetical protein
VVVVVVVLIVRFAADVGSASVVRIYFTTENSFLI